MSGFLDRWRRLPLRHQTGEVHEDAEDKNLIRVLVITHDDNYYFSVHGVATDSGWETRMVRTVEPGLLVLDEFRASVAIYDWRATEADWQFDVDRLTGRPDHPCVLLASVVDDEYLRAEVVRHGGFDVIPRSADGDRLIRNIQFAHFFRRSSQTVRGGRPFVR